MEPIACPNCGHRIEDPAREACPACGVNLGAQRAERSAPPEAAAAAGGAAGSLPPPPVNSVPFEDTSQPFFERLLRTVGMAFADPMRLFSSMERGDIGLPLLYGVLVGTVTTVVSVLWQMMFGGMAMLAEGVEAGEFAVGTGLYVAIIVFSPVFAALGLFVSSAIYHVALLILGDGGRGFSVTFRALAYGNTPGLLALVPFCGGIVGGAWALVLVIIGAKLGHGTDWWRAILGYFLPAIVCCCLAVWLVMSFGLLGALTN